MTRLFTSARTGAFVLRAAFSAAPAGAALVSALAMVQQATGLVLALWIGALIDLADHHATTEVLLAAAAAAGLCLALVLVAFMAGWRFRIQLRERINVHVDRRLMRTLGDRPTLDRVSDRSVQDALEVLRLQRSTLGGAFEALMGLAGLAVQIAVSVWLLARASPAAVVLPLAAAAPVLMTHWAARSLAAGQRDAARHLRRARDWSELAGTGAGARELRAFGASEAAVSRQADAWAQAGLIISGREMGPALLTAASWIAYGAALLAVLEAAVGARVDLATAVVGLAVMAQLTGQLQMFVGQWGQAQRGLAVVDLVLSILEFPAAPAPAAREDPAPLTGGVTLRDVTFRYGTGAPALESVSCRLPAGAVVALVGENGAGKTTFVELILGLRRPSRGVIEWDGTDIGAFEAGELRRRLTGTFQDFCRFEFRAGQVVGFGEVAHMDDPARVTAALRRSGGGGFVADLAKGLDTPLGASLGGARLSGGQWQQLAVGRGEMRPEAWVRVLDEPTASLDPRREAALFERYAGLARQPGAGVTLLVTHRLATAAIADLVLVLSEGRLVQQGTHAELLSAPGQYADLFRLQSRQIHLG